MAEGGADGFVRFKPLFGEYLFGDRSLRKPKIAELVALLHASAGVGRGDAPLPRDAPGMLAKHALERLSSTPASTALEVQYRIVLTHALALGDYGPQGRAEVMTEKKLVETASQLPVGYEPGGDDLRRLMEHHTGMRNLWAAAASGFGRSKNTFRRGSPHYRGALDLLWTELRPMLASPTLLKDALGIEVTEKPSALSIRGGGWGPARDAVSWRSRPALAVLNSIADDPAYGDQRNFFRVRPAGDPAAPYESYVTAEPGAEYEALARFANGARPGSGAVATGARVRIQAPETFEGSGRFTAFLAAENAVPGTVWDAFVVGLRGPGETAAVRFLPRSAFFVVGEEALALGDELYGPDGAPVGSSAPDGRLLPDDGPGGFLGFSFRTDRPDFVVGAGLRKIGSPAWSRGFLEVRPGDALEAVVKYRNTGTTVQRDVVLRLGALPPELVPTPGSVAVSNGASGGSWVRSAADIAEPLNAGHYAPGAAAYVRFELTVRDAASLGPGPGKWLVMDRFCAAETANGTKSTALTLALVR